MSDTENNRTIVGLNGLGKLPKFNGKGNLKSFLREIEKRSKIEGWDDDQKAEILKFSCVGNAEAYLAAHPETDELNYTDLCNKLTERFGSRTSKTEAYATLLGTKQNRQSVEEYAGRIETLAAEYVDIIEELADYDTRSELLTSVFITGLDNYLKKALVTVDNDSFEDAVKMAKKCENVLIEPRRNMTGAVNVEDRDFQGHRNVTIECWSCGGNHYQRNCPGHNSNRGRGSYRGYRGRGWQGPQSYGRGSYRNYRNPYGYNGPFQNEDCQCTDSCSHNPKN